MVTESSDYKQGELANRIVDFGQMLDSTNAALAKSHNQADVTWKTDGAVKSLMHYRELDERHKKIVKALGELAGLWTPRRIGSRAIEQIALRHDLKERATHLTVDFRCIRIEGEASISLAIVDLSPAVGRKLTLEFEVEKRGKADQL